MTGEALHLSLLELLPSCEDCPIGGREGGPRCWRTKLCDVECHEMMEAMSREDEEELERFGAT